MKKVLFLLPAQEKTESNLIQRPLTITLQTHYLDRPSERSFIHPSGLLVSLAGARLVDCQLPETGEVQLEFEPGMTKPAEAIEFWTVIIPPLPSTEASPSAA